MESGADASANQRKFFAAQWFFALGYRCGVAWGRWPAFNSRHSWIKRKTRLTGTILKSSF